MSTSFLLLCLVLLFTLVVCEEDISLFSDAKCSQAIADNPQTIDMPETPKCESIPVVGWSFINTCTSSSTTTVLDLRIWMQSGSCGGTPEASYQSSGPVGQCNPITIAVPDQTINAYALIKCAGKTLQDSINATLATTHGLLQQLRAPVSPLKAFALRK